MVNLPDQVEVGDSGELVAVLLPRSAAVVAMDDRDAYWVESLVIVEEKGFFDGHWTGARC